MEYTTDYYGTTYSLELSSLFAKKLSLVQKNPILSYFIFLKKYFVQQVTIVSAK